MPSPGRSSSSKPPNRDPSFTRPAPAAAPLPRRNSFTKMVHNAQDWFAGLSGPIVGKTRPEELVEQTRELSFGYAKQGTASYEKVEALTEGSEVKHTKPVPLRSQKHWEYRDSQTHRFPQEARILGMTLKANRNIVQMMEILPDPSALGRYFLWFEHCSGGDLYSQVMHWWVKKRQPVPGQFLLHTYVSVADGLAFLHHGLRSRGHGKYTEDEFHTPVIHGDLSMQNIFLRWTDEPLPEVVIGDFGVSKVPGRDAAINPGRPDFHAPEDVAIHQNAPFDNLDIWLKMVNARTTKSDIYACGQVLYMIAGKEHSPQPVGVNPSSLRISREYDTPGLAEAIQKCFVVDPAQRAEASFRDGNGMLPAVNRFRTARDVLISRGTLDRLEWNRPKPN